MKITFCHTKEKNCFLKGSIISEDQKELICFSRKHEKYETESNSIFKKDLSSCTATGQVLDSWTAAGRVWTSLVRSGF